VGSPSTEGVRAGLRRLTHDDWIVVGGAALLVVGTRLPWYGAAFEVRGVTIEVTATGWERTGYFGALTSVLCCLAALVVIAKGLGPERRWLERVAAAAATIAGGVSFLLTLWRLFDAPAGVQERRYGIFVALFAALVVSLAGASGLGGGREAATESARDR